MPVNGPATYLPTTNEFLAHWASVNAEPGFAGPLILRGGVSIADLTALRDELAARRAAVEAARNGREEVRALLEQKKAQMLRLLNRFNTQLDAVTEDRVWMALRPRAFSQTDGMSKVIPALDSTEDVWRRFEEDGGVALVLLGGTTRAQFAAALGELKAFYSGFSVHDNGIRLARLRRTETEGEIHTVLVKYRKAIPAAFDEESPLYVTMPRLTPLPGRTPEPVTLSAGYDAEVNAASASWTGSGEKDLEGYELRGCVGEEYNAEDEAVLAHIPPGAPREWTGAFGLALPGAAVSLRVYVETATGNERASNPVTVTRPLDG